MVRILALNPPFMPKYSRQSRSPCVTKGGTLYYPYYLAYAVGAAEHAGFEVDFIDAITNEWTSEQTVAFAMEKNPNLIVIDTSTPSIFNDLRIADQLKKALPDTHITLVGTFPTHMGPTCFSLTVVSQ